MQAGHSRAEPQRYLPQDQEDYFDLFCRLVEDYERERVDAPKVTVLEASQHLLDARGMNEADLAKLLDVHRTLGAMILRGERKLALNHVRTLARHFGVSAEVFVS